ncbi:MAG TPA: EAL domain-containing protein [Bryobacteraceae bacterium]|jgi:diguanylate cyclase (GGDEF)-like protein|nr:EAL domain-containing protein [Bryobacteraceae bacterium]
MDQSKRLSISHFGIAGAISRYSLALAATGIALYASDAFRGQLGNAGVYLPPLLAALISAACAGIWPALLSQLIASAAIFLFIARPVETPVRAIDLFSLALFLVIGTIAVLLRRKWEGKTPASYDSLIGLPNREAFLDRLERAASWSQAGTTRHLALLIIDIDRFKVINESLGHRVGDELLARVATSLAECLRAGDMAARFAGDEFAVLLDGVESVEDARQIAERIKSAISTPIAIRGHDIVVTVSIGIALVDVDKPEAALRHAGVAMHRAKSGGKARCEVFEPAVDTHAMGQLQIETDLRQGIQQDAFRVYYQPIISLRTGEIASFEALLRWHHPQRGVLLPGQFLAVAEEAGLVLALGQLVLRQACRQLQAWRSRALGRGLRLGVNVSGKEFADPLIADTFRQTLEQTQLSGDALIVELTESIIMEDRQLALEKLRLLRELGIELAVDDFGTGYSALARLQDFPISSLKADASFVSGISEGKPEIFDAIVALAHELHLEVTAEGVETAEQLEYLRQSGAAYAQGLFLSDALSPTEAEALLKTNPPWKAIFDRAVDRDVRKRVAMSGSR